jgi:hypothetical protein
MVKSSYLESRSALGAAAWASILVVVAVAAVASVLVLGNVGSIQTSSTSSVLIATSTSAASTSTSAKSPAAGLELSLSLNASAIAKGEGINATVVEVNTMTAVDNVSAADDWPVADLATGPCGHLNSPVGIEVLSGNYDAANVTSGTALQVYNPGLTMCPVMLSGITGYVFQPGSDNSTVYGGCGPGACFNETATATLSITGYWSANASASGSFPSGVYTVVAGDEWGGLAILHFTVTGSSA